MIIDTPLGKLDVGEMTLTMPGGLKCPVDIEMRDGEVHVQLHTPDVPEDELGCDFAPPSNAHRAGKDAITLSGEEIAENAVAYATLLSREVPENIRDVVCLDLQRYARGASELHNLTQSGDWLVCAKCHAEYTAIKESLK